MYDYLIVGSGLFGSTCAYELNKKGYKCLIIEKRNHIGGNIFTLEKEGIHIHKYGAHIFHTDDENIWDYINKFSEFNNYINMPIARYYDEEYNLPFNMNTFVKIFKDVKTPLEAQNKIKEEIEKENIKEIKNLEDQAISLVGRTIYEKLIKGYTSKQWGRPCNELPSFIIKRLPVRFTFDNNYFTDKYQGIPIKGYTEIIKKMLEGIEVRLNTDYLKNKKEYENIANKIIYTGTIDEYFEFVYGELEYRSLFFEEEELNIDDYQHNAVVNYTDDKTPFTRIIEHKHFLDKKIKNKTIISKEYPIKYEKGLDAYYPINNEKNNKLFLKYLELSKQNPNIIFGGRLGQYKYLDMDDTIIEALNLIKNITNKNILK